MVAAVAAAQPVVEVAEVHELPERGLVQLPVPESLAGDGELVVVFDGETVLSQEVIGGGTCFVRPTDAQRTRSKTDAVKVSMSRMTKSSADISPMSRVEVKTDAFTMGFDAARGGLPTTITWASGRQVKGVFWGDRAYAAGNDQGLRGSWMLVNYKGARLLDYGKGPLFHQVKVFGEYALGDGHVSSAKPKAVYDWIFPHDASEWVLLVMNISEESAGTWDQLWSGVLHFPYGAFSKCQTGGKGEPQSHVIPKSGAPMRWNGAAWAAVMEGDDFAAVYSKENSAYFDPNPKSRTFYLHSSNNSSRQTWSGSPMRRTALFRFGSRFTDDEMRPFAVPRSMRRLDLIAAAESVRPGEKVSAATIAGITVRTGLLPGGKVEIKKVEALGRTIAIGPQKLFEAVVEKLDDGRRINLDSTIGWSAVECNAEGWVFRGPAGHPELRDLEVVISMKPGEDDSKGPSRSATSASLEWSYRGDTGTNGYAFAEVTVGALEFLSSGSGMRALFPHVEGLVMRHPCEDAASQRGNYPAMHCAMQWEAVWDERSGDCFYVGAHDPYTGAKWVSLRGSSERSAVKLAITHRLSWDGKTPSQSEMSGPIVWKAMKGDWYDAALTYRDWTREHCVSYPEMGPEGRVSTPMWFKKLGFICRTRTHAQKDMGVPAADVKLCQDYLGVPVMAHWYEWHPSPFDNDYPHYYPPKPGVEAEVENIHQMGGYAVPYTNGHIWDMHDRGCEDWQFSKVGAKGACVKRDGTLYTERYHSMETNGQPVVFAPMCPASEVWRAKVQENCVNVIDRAGFNAYYMDQVGAFSTLDCRSAAHGHPFGGGHWWQDAYRVMLDEAKAKRGNKETLFITECNAEHTLRQIDAFVCWNILGGVDTVPAYEVCYSTAAFVYCRSYRTGKDAAREMRMKFANILADGEMLGWFPSQYCRDEAIGPFLRECVRFRWHNAEWFYKAEMRRPPALEGTVPEWSETWDVFGGKHAVTMPIVQTGARVEYEYDYTPEGKRIWRSARPKKAFVYFVNFSDAEAALAKVKLDWADLGVDPAKAILTKVDSEGRRTPFPRAALDAALAFPPGTCWGLEIK